MAERPTTLTFLLDTNAVITLEPYAGSFEQIHPVLSEFLRRAREHHHHVVVHPANEDDLAETSDDAHRAANFATLRKYQQIAEPPIPAAFAEAAGDPTPETNDHRDLRLLAAIHAGAATHLVTSDEKLIKKAARLGLGERVLRPEEALDFLRQLYPDDPQAPPQVELISASMLRLDEPIFESLRSDYSEFDDWVKAKVAPDLARRTWVVSDADDGYRALAIVKPADDHPLLPGRRAMKISTFKVDERAGGEKLGELLLKTILNWAYEMRVESIFVTVIKDESKLPLVRFLEQFGFVEIGDLPGADNEAVFEKQLVPLAGEVVDPLRFHVLHGPPAISGAGDVYVIPVQPKWYNGLFPDSPGTDGQVALPGLSGVEIGPFGNAIRKAYLSNSKIKEIPAGSTVLFYRSGTNGGRGAITAVGVVEQTLRSFDPVEILELVGRRTVYSAEEVGRMCESGVIAVMFRQDRFLTEPWTLAELMAAGVVNGPPQSILRVASKRGVAWVNQQLSA